MMPSLFFFLPSLIIIFTHVVAEQKIFVPATFNLTKHYDKVRKPLHTLGNNKLPLCTHNAHIHGQWVEGRRNHTKKAYPCCGWDDKDFKWNTTLCGEHAMNGDWWYAGDTSGPLFLQFGGHACACDAVLGRTEAHAMQRYQWRPSYCRLIPFNAEYFCALLGPRRLLFIGDSTFAQTMTALVNLIRTGRGNCLGKILFAHINKLTDWDGHKFDWMDHMLLHDPQIVVLGAGAHIHSLDVYKQTLAVFFKQWQGFEERRVREHIPQGRMSPQNISYVWKTINPGHLGCGNASAPLLTPAFFNASDPRDYFAWGPFDVFDALGKELALSRGMSVVDMFPLYLRPDAHPNGGDCLHFCAPGPIDMIGELLMNKMHNGEI